VKWNVPNGLFYTETHEWAKEENGSVVEVGITDYAQDKLGGVVFVELPEEGDVLSKGESIAVIESVKAVVDTYAPVTGKVVEVNRELEDRPEALNEAPYEEGWILKMEMENRQELEELMEQEQYREHVIKQEEEEQ